MNEEKYFLNDEYESANEHAEFDLDDFDLENGEDVENLYWYVRGLQQKLAYIITCYDFTKQSEKKEENRHREFKTNVERRLLKILQNEADDSDWLNLGYEFKNIASVTDYKLSFLCYQKAAQLSNNDSYSSFILGDCYENGIGTPVDEKRALELNEKAKQISHEQTIQSNKKRFESFEKKLTETTEVTTKNANSWIAFGDCYKNGRGTEKNLEKAKECYKKVLAFYEKTDTTAKNYRIVLKRLEEIKRGIYSNICL